LLEARYLHLDTYSSGLNLLPKGESALGLGKVFNVRIRFGVRLRVSVVVTE